MSKTSNAQTAFYLASGYVIGLSHCATWGRALVHGAVYCLVLWLLAACWDWAMPRVRRVLHEVTAP